MKVAIVTDSLTNLTAADLQRYPNVYYGYLNVIVNPYLLLKNLFYVIIKAN